MHKRRWVLLRVLWVLLLLVRVRRRMAVAVAAGGGGPSPDTPSPAATTPAAALATCHRRTGVGLGTPPCRRPALRGAASPAPACAAGRHGRVCTGACVRVRVWVWVWRGAWGVGGACVPLTAGAECQVAPALPPRLGGWHGSRWWRAHVLHARGGVVGCECDRLTRCVRGVLHRGTYAHRAPQRVPCGVCGGWPWRPGCRGAATAACGESRQCRMVC